MKNLSGVIVSQKNLKTVTVEITYRKPHPKYKKIVEKRVRKKAHYDGNIDLSVGDVVDIRPSRPFSATKKFLVIGVKVKAKK